MDTNDLRQYVPERLTWLRAVVGSIPVVGCALDHLLFDKADAIRLKNLEAAIAAISEQLSKLHQDTIDKDWFQSEEALATFKLLSDKVSYEPDKAKVDALGRVVATCGTVQYSKDHRKLSVVEHLSRLSSTQIKLLSAIHKTSPKEKKVAGGDLVQTATAIWINDVKATLETGEVFWVGTMKLDEELEVLESFNTIRRVQLLAPSELGFTLTTIGKQAASYVQSAGL